MKEKIYIVGAHSRAQTLAVYLQTLYPDLTVEAYLYNNHEQNPEKIGDVPVVYMNTADTALCTRYPVYIGTRGIYHNKITEDLKQMGFQTIYPVTMELDLKLRNLYLKKYFRSIGRRFVKLDELSSTRKRRPLSKASKAVYVVKSVFDKPLHQEYRQAPYEREIQVGAELTNAPALPGLLQDNTGDHISEKNRQFCELTALYWIWKHAKEEIIGLAHYRRHFILPEDWADRMQEHEIDVVLPVPLYVAPSVAENFKKRHDPEDWNFMMQCLEERDTGVYCKANIFFKGNLYSPCNMFLMRRNVLYELCEWIFPILFQTAEHGGQREDRYRNRYPAFLSERLITFFFEYNREKYKLAYADKNFLF